MKKVIVILISIVMLGLLILGVYIKKYKNDLNSVKETITEEKGKTVEENKEITEKNGNIVGESKETTTQNINPQESTNAKIISFEYEYGSYWGGYYYYNIETIEEKIIFTAKGYNGVELDICKQVSEEDIKKLDSIIKKYKIDEWNGFNESDIAILDGYSYTLKVEYSDGRKIESYGYEKYPENYEEGDKELSELLKQF